MAFTLYKQLNAMDCGPTSLRMIAKYYGRHYNAETLRKKAGFSKAGVSLLGISETAEKIGFRSRGVTVTYEQLKEAALPCILHWNQNHFVVLVSTSNRDRVKIADPAKGMLTYSKDEFLDHWISSSSSSGNSESTGVALLLEPSPSFYGRTKKNAKLVRCATIFETEPLADCPGIGGIIIFFADTINLPFPYPKYC